MKKKAIIDTKNNPLKEGYIVRDFKNFREGNKVGVIRSNNGEALVINLEQLNYIKIVEDREEDQP